MKKLSPRFPFVAMFCFLLFFSCTTSIEPPPPSSQQERYCVYQDSRECFPTTQNTCPVGGDLSDFCPYGSSSSTSLPPSSDSKPISPPESCFGDNEMVSCCFDDLCVQIEYSACYFFDGKLQDSCN